MPDFEQAENEHDNLLVISQIGLFEDVEQWIENPRVGGSIPPPPGTMYKAISMS